MQTFIGIPQKSIQDTDMTQDPGSYEDPGPYEDPGC